MLDLYGPGTAVQLSSLLSPQGAGIQQAALANASNDQPAELAFSQRSMNRAAQWRLDYRSMNLRGKPPNVTTYNFTVDSGATANLLPHNLSHLLSEVTDDNPKILVKGIENSSSKAPLRVIKVGTTSPRAAWQASTPRH